MKKLIFNIVLVALIATIISCTTTSVTRVATDEQTDLSGRWNDTDSRLVAEYMVDELLSARWIDNHMADWGEKPVVVVGLIGNKTSEHIQTDNFINDIERELVNSGSVRFVAGGATREALTNEREYQQSNAREDSAVALAAETGADFMLTGVISSQTDSIEGKRAVFYKIDLELINIETNEISWIGTKEIKKVIERSRASW